MKSTLYLKFIIIYLILGFLSIFTIATLSSQLIKDSLIKNSGKVLYTEATSFSSKYLSSYFVEQISKEDLNLQLSGLCASMHASAWFVDKNGNFIEYVSVFGQQAPESIPDFDPLENGSDQYQVGNYHNLLAEDVISVIVPVTHDFSTKGYLLLHRPLADIEEAKSSLLLNVYITFTVIYIFTFLILLGIHLFIYIPLTEITEAAKQYALGNLDYEIPVSSSDEIGFLSASLNYMSRQLKDMEDYQKKFIGNVSHDFRSPLTSIKGYVEAMADGTIPPQMQEKYLKIILFETERLTDLTKDLLTLNEFDTKELLLNKSSFDIHEVIKMTAESFEGRCTSRKLSIELLFASKTLTVYADQRKIQQVLYNLIDNALKFSPEGSSITVETTERSGKVSICVKDHGIGIPKSSLGKIWERFYKTDQSRGKDKKGTGLGLAIVKEILQAHNENINVISTEGVGTEFTFSLPKERQF
ncbi:sensor histidine kinase [Lachnoclostridium sp. An181]|uniref:sensor histidine kinase n=1 Tax=Lachnoclostridium sp. An181 TaxID=1965575 RepID=UPI000B392C2D|nr:HAMP domain-containing sensor histidine kinase [Lachnoclostridium sp. An181]OUP49369.1 two-component sensor histidine kinase [Lachnoclostridium sp. An181]